MKLKSIEYSEYKNKPIEWKVEGLEIGDINLIVGVNASGKTRSLLHIYSLSLLLSRGMRGLVNPPDFYYKVNFEEGKRKIVYELEVSGYKVKKEKLTDRSKVVLRRGSSEEGMIYAEKLNKEIEFKIPGNQIAAYMKRDQIQHPFLESLFEWAVNLRFFRFGSDMGKESQVDSPYLPIKESRSFEEKIELLQLHPNVADTIEIGMEKYGAQFKISLFEEMREIGYHIDAINIHPLDNGAYSYSTAKNRYVSIQEKELSTEIEQHNISQGMWRTLSLLAHINLFIAMKKASCVLIDDIGEGLDYNRSLSLIKLLIKKARKSKIQLIMTTNDRFVMNSVPLQNWSILHRTGGKCRIINQRNSKEVFEKFKYTGLDNFDFFSSQYFMKDLKSSG